MKEAYEDIFDDLVPNEPKGLSSLKEAIAVVALGAAASDGSVSSEERLRFVALALGSPLFPNDIEDIITEATRIAHFVDKLGSDKALKMAGRNLTAGLKETAFSWAVDIVVSDGWLDKREKEYLEHVIAEFDIDSVTAKKIVEVIKIRNRVD